MKQGILAVSFGTTGVQGAQDLAAMETALQGLYPEKPFYRAFTSPTVRRVLAGRGQQVPGYEEALARAAADGVTRLAVQPTHLLAGIEYDRLAQTTARWQSRFEVLALGQPLLAENKDIEALAAGLAALYPPEPGRMVVLFGHGTAHRANAVYPALQKALHRLSRQDMTVGTVEGAPRWEDVMAAVGAAGCRRVLLAPLMVVAGEHVTKDMAGDEPESWVNRFRAAGVEAEPLLRGMGRTAVLQKLAAEHLKAVVENNGF